MKKIILFFCFVFLSFSERNIVPSMTENFRKNIATLIDEFESVLELDEKIENLPDSAWFGSDKKSTKKEIENLINSALEILEISDLVEMKEKLRRIERRIEFAKKRISEYRNKMLSAPIDSWFRTTVKGFQEKIKLEENLIREQKKEKRETKEKINLLLSSSGLELNKEQLEMLLSSVIGDDIISMASVFKNLKNITIQFYGLSKENQENVEEARRYYGIYMVSLQVLEQMYKKFIDTIENSHIPKIDTFIKQAENNIIDANKGIKSKLGDIDILKANISSNLLTKKVAETYKKYLFWQKDTIEKREKKLQKNIYTSRNTYKTVKLSHQVITLLNRGMKDFDTLLNLKMPEFAVFKSSEMKKTFLNLSLRLKNWKVK